MLHKLSVSLYSSEKIRQLCLLDFLNTSLFIPPDENFILDLKLHLSASYKTNVHHYKYINAKLVLKIDYTCFYCHLGVGGGGLVNHNKSIVYCNL